MVSYHVQWNNKYIMVAVELDSNYINADPMKSCSAKELIHAYQSIYQCWKATGVICTNWHVTDNEAPEELKKAFHGNDFKVELTPADMHRHAAKWGTKTIKGHFISVLVRVANDFPIHQGDELIKQTLLTLNLLRQSSVGPKVSAYACHHSWFDYSQMSSTPMGCAVQFYIKANRQHSWDEHASDGWYLGTLLEHYCCHNTFVKATGHVQISDCFSCTNTLHSQQAHLQMQ